MNGIALPPIPTPSWLRNRVVLPDANVLDTAVPAQHLNMTRTTLLRLCRQHKITHSRLDYRTFIFLKEDLNEYLSRCRYQRRNSDIAENLQAIADDETNLGELEAQLGRIIKKMHTIEKMAGSEV